MMVNQMRMARVVLPLFLIGACGERDERPAPVDVVQSAVTAPACNTPKAAGVACVNPAGCAHLNCGGYQWPNKQMYYEYQTSGSDAMDASDRAFIDGVIASWNSRMYAFQIVKCANTANQDSCVSDPNANPNLSASSPSGRWLRIHQIGAGGPCGADFGIGNQAATGQQDAVVGKQSGSPNVWTNYIVAHMLGHCLGMPHTFERRDRDRYVSLSTMYWCGQDPPGATPLCPPPPARCAPGVPYSCAVAPVDRSENPAVTTGLFGLYDSLSPMNYVSNDICENDGIEPDCSALPTAEDGSAIDELAQSYDSWVPFQNLGTDVSATAPLDGSISASPLVTIKAAGSFYTAAAASSWGWPALDIFVEGSDNHIYYKYKNVSSGVFQSWSSWTDLSGGATFSSAPASVSWASGRTDLVANKSVGNPAKNQVYIKTFASGAWSAWSALPTLTGGASSAPTIASWGVNRLDVFVLDSSSHLQHIAYNGSSWGSWGVVNGTTQYAGRPSAVARISGGVGRIDVVAATTANPPLISWTRSTDGTGGNWSAPANLPNISILSGTSPTVARTDSNALYVFFSGGNSLLWATYCTGSCQSTSGWGTTELGGVLNSNVGVVGDVVDHANLNVIAVKADHTKPGVWWKYWPNNDLKNHYVGVGQAPPNCPN